MSRVISFLSRAFVVFLCFGSFSADADVFQPAFLQLKQTDAETYDVLWKVPARGEERLALYVRLPDATENLTEPQGAFIVGSYVERWRVRHPGGLTGQTIHIDGLAGSAADVLARIERIDGTSQVARPQSAQSSFVVEASAGTLEVARTYTLLGIEHILSGFDHLLFVLALLFLVRGGRRIVLTITAFTVAHSITLAAATLGVVNLPGPPVEATIALSIVFLAREMAMAVRGRTGFTQQYPWLVAFAFGLLHGLGFAGVLSEIGLPQHAIPLALLCFNIGVEIGQLLFIGVALSLFMAMRHWLSSGLTKLRWLPPYVIGGVASYWLVARVAAF